MINAEVSEVNLVIVQACGVVVAGDAQSDHEHLAAWHGEGRVIEDRCNFNVFPGNP